MVNELSIRLFVIFPVSLTVSCDNVNIAIVAIVLIAPRKR